MAKLKAAITDRSEPDPNDTSGFGYTGKMPPVANYHCNLKWLRIGLDKNGDQRWNGPCEISEPDGSRAAKYNGYTIWIGQSFTNHPRSKAYMASLARALGVTWKDILDRVVVDKSDFSKEDPATVTKIGRVKIDAIDLIVVSRTEKDQNGDPRLGISQFLPADWEPDDDEDEDEDDDADDDDDSDEYDEEDDDEEDDEEEDDEEDEEPASPPRKSAARKAPARKAPAKSASRKRRAAAADDDDEIPF